MLFWILVTQCMHSNQKFFVVFVKITLQYRYIDKVRFCVKILCLSGLKLPLKSLSAESEFPRNSSDHNKVGGEKVYRNQKLFFYFFLFDYELCYKHSEKHCFFVVREHGEVILIENPQFSPCHFWLHILVWLTISFLMNMLDILSEAICTQGS
jgi:hypothetical protein